MYDGALVMPRNCVAMSNDEMMYLEGGGTVTVVLTKGFLQTVQAASWAAIGGIVGGTIGGPVGATVGGVIGAAVGYCWGKNAKSVTFKINVKGCSDKKYTI